MSLSWRVGALLAVTGVVAISVMAHLGGVLPAFASESRERALQATHASWHAFATDLASASGCMVNYEAPVRERRGGEALSLSMAEELGGIGMLRIGAADGPSVLVLPDAFLQTKQVSAAYAQVGLAEPRVFAQKLVMSASFEQDAAVRADSAPGEHPVECLSELLRDTSVLIPVFMQHGTRAQRGAGAAQGSPRRNFPARWEAASAATPSAAGPYPASHPSVRALTGWLNGATDCAGVILVREKCRGAESTKGFDAGTLEAFCEEVLKLSVQETEPAGCGAAILQALRSAPKLSFSDVLWTRLGSTNWSLEVTVDRFGEGRTLGDAVLLAATPVEGEVVLTAAAASVGTESPELLPLRNRGVLLEGMAPGTSRRVRLFFTESVDRDELGRVRPQASNSSPMPSVDLEATAPRARRAVMRSQSPL